MIYQACSDRSIQRLNGQAIKSSDHKLILEGKLKALKVELESIKSEIENYNRKANSDKQALDSLFIQSRTMNKSVLDLAATSEEFKETVKQKEYEKQHLRKDIIEQKKELYYTKSKMEELQKHQEKIIVSLNSTNQKYLNSIESLRVQEMKVKEFEQHVKDLSGSLSRQKLLYESLRKDSNNCSNQIAEKQEEIIELKGKFQVAQQQVESERKVLIEKRASLTKLNAEIRNSRYENDIMKTELKNSTKNVKILEEIVTKQKDEMKRLSEVLKKSEQEKYIHEQEHFKAIKERDVVNSSLHLKTQEVENLAESLRSQELELSSALLDCKEKYKELEECKKENIRIRLDCNKAKNKISHIQMISSDIKVLQKQLIQEKLKTTVLSQEMKKPTQIHKMRVIEVSEPMIFEMITNIRHLQKQIINRNKQLSIKDYEIEEKQKLLDKLKNSTGKIPEYQLLKNWLSAKQELSKKSKEIKSLLSELTEYRKQVHSLKTEIELLSKEENLSNI